MLFGVPWVLETVMTSRAEQYRQLARDFHFMARDLPPGENRSTLLKMAEECERLADQQEQATDLRQERLKRVRRREIRLAEKPNPERLREDRQKQAQDHISSELEGEPQIRLPPTMRCRKFRRSSAAVATSREGHRSPRSGRAGQHRRSGLVQAPFLATPERPREWS